MTKSLAHRGPDGEGVFVRRNVGLGHRRLSIIDVDGGAQPMFSDDRTIAIVFNGEIYNYKELRQELVQRGHRFHTNSDTEVILRLYEEKGHDCLHELNGMFAFAIWDEAKKQLFAARDRLGEKPFYFSTANAQLVFASEIKALHLAPSMDFRIDRNALDDYLAYGYVPAPHSIYENVHKLPPAHYLVWQQGDTQIKRYWKADFSASSRNKTDAEYAEKFLELLSDSIRIRLRSDVPIGAFLSGGVDSSIMVALASQQMSGPLNTFTVRFNESDFDESPYARLVAERYQTDHKELIVDDMDLSILPDLVKQFDEPFADASAIPTFFVCHAASQHVKVCISGDAGDELFGGYPQYRWEPLEQIVDKLPAAMRRSIFEPLAARLPKHVSGVGWLRRMAASGSIRFQRKQGVFDSIERTELFRPEFGGIIDHEATLFQQVYAALNLDEIGLRMAVDQETYLPDDILVKVDRNSMLNGLEVRVPFLDHRIVEFANTLPHDQKIRGNMQKHILKRLAVDLLPEQILQRPKQGFGLPLKHWFRNQYRDFARDMLLSPDTRCHEFFRKSTICDLFDAHMKGKRDLSDRLWCLLWFELWCRNQPSELRT